MIAVTWLVCVAGWLVAISVPNVYTSFARIYVDTDSLLNPLLKGIAVETDIDARVAVMGQTLLSRPNLEKVVRTSDLDLAAKTTVELDAVLANLQASVSISSPSDKIYIINYHSSSPALAKRVVDALLATFVESNLGASRENMGVAVRFIDEQIAADQRELAEAEQRLAEFKRANLDVLAGKNDFFQEMREARDALAQSKALLEESLKKRETLQQQLAAEPRYLESALGAGSSGPPSDEEVRILELEKALDSLLSRYTDKHPDVLATKRRLAALREAIAVPAPVDAPQDPAQGPAPARDAGPSETATEVNPVHDQVKLQLVSEEATIATLNSRIAQQETTVGRLEKTMQTVPEIEQQNAELERKVEAKREHLDELLTRQGSARMSQERDKTETVQFRIVDPPTLPSVPTGPNRFLLLGLALVGGIGAGVAFGLALVFVSDTFSDVRRLRQAFALPVLGSVSFVRGSIAGWGRAMNGIVFASACAGLLIAFVGLVASDGQARLAKLALPWLTTAFEQ